MIKTKIGDKIVEVRDGEEVAAKVDGYCAFKYRGRGFAEARNGFEFLIRNKVEIRKNLGYNLNRNECYVAYIDNWGLAGTRASINFDHMIVKLK
jgi:hypothetical protein